MLRRSILALALASPAAFARAQGDFAQWLERWETLSPEQRQVESADAGWSLEDWLYWFEFENRYWYWWDAKFLPESDRILVQLEIDDWPFPSDALQWLFIVAGASSFESEI